MSIKLNLLRDLNLKSYPPFLQKKGQLTLGAKIFLMASGCIGISMIYLAGSDSFKTLNSAEKYKLNAPEHEIEIQIPKVNSVADALSNGGSKNTSDALSKSASLKVSFDEIDLSKGFVLDDAEGKISSDFQIPEGKEKAVAFWFDLYTKFTSDQLIIFNKKYPWIIYDVISTQKIKHKLTNEEIKFRIDKIKYTVSELVENFNKENKKDFNSHLETKDQLQLFKLYDDALGFDVNKVQDSLKYIDYTYGLKESFIEKISYHSKFIKTIEFIFSKNQVDTEWARLFLISPLKKVTSENDETALHKNNLGSNIVLLNKAVQERFLMNSKYINENLSPIKVAQILSVLIKNLDEVETEKSILSKQWLTFEGDVEAAFLAALHADEYYRELFTEGKQTSALPIKAYRLKEDTEVRQLVKLSGMSPSKFFEVNPDIVLNEDYINYFLKLTTQKKLTSKVKSNSTSKSKSFSKSKSERAYRSGENNLGRYGNNKTNSIHPDKEIILNAGFTFFVL